METRREQFIVRGRGPQHSKATTDQGDEGVGGVSREQGSKSDGVAAKKKKKKRSMKKGFVNPIAVMSTRSPEKSGAGGVA